MKDLKIILDKDETKSNALRGDAERILVEADRLDEETEKVLKEANKGSDVNREIYRVWLVH